MDEAGGQAVEPVPREPKALSTNRQLGLVIALAVAAYLSLALAVPGLSGAVRIGVPFLLVPLALFAFLRQPLELGRIDRGFLLSAASYAPFAVAAAAAAPGARWFYAALALSVATPAMAAVWAVETFLHVGAVDFFTKRVVQREAEPRFGAARALWIQVAVWSGAHVIEWLWLRFLFGEVAAAVYLVAAGVVTGLAYMRWKNVLGLMVGHLLVNVAAAAAAVSAFG